MRALAVPPAFPFSRTVATRYVITVARVAFSVLFVQPVAAAQTLAHFFLEHPAAGDTRGRSASGLVRNAAKEGDGLPSNRSTIA